MPGAGAAGRPAVRSLGERLRRLRLERHLSLYDVERLTGRHFSTIGRYERGERQPDLETLRELATTYGVSMAEILGDTASLVSYLPRDLRETATLLLDRPDLRRLIQLAASFEPPVVEQLCSLLALLGPGGPSPGREEARRPS